MYPKTIHGSRSALTATIRSSLFVITLVQLAACSTHTVLHLRVGHRLEATASVGADKEAFHHKSSASVDARRRGERSVAGQRESSSSGYHDINADDGAHGFVGGGLNVVSLGNNTRRNGIDVTAILASFGLPEVVDGAVRVAQLSRGGGRADLELLVAPLRLSEGPRTYYGGELTMRW